MRTQHRQREVWIEIPPRLASDKRTYSDTGMLTVTGCTITAAVVSPYLGREILGVNPTLALDPERLYFMYRDAAALKAAVPLIDGKPLLIDHEGVSAADPRQQLIIGTVRDCRWVAPKVVGTVEVWSAVGIEGIETKVRRDLSLGYSYVPDMTSGTINGQSYDGVMRGPIRPNHLALIPEGRVIGAMVSDAAPRTFGALDTVSALKALEHEARRNRENDPMTQILGPHYARLK